MTIIKIINNLYVTTRFISIEFISEKLLTKHDMRWCTYPTSHSIWVSKVKNFVRRMKHFDNGDIKVAKGYIKFKNGKYIHESYTYYLEIDMTPQIVNEWDRYANYDEYVLEYLEDYIPKDVDKIICMFLFAEDEIRTFYLA